MTNEMAIEIIEEIMNIPHTDTVSNRRKEEALSKAIEALKYKIEYDERQSNW